LTGGGLVLRSFDQPGRWSSESLSVRLVSTKYGATGPRFGLLAGRKDLVGRIRVEGFELGMEVRQMLYPAVVRTDSLLEERRFEPLVPLAVKTLLGHTFPSAMMIEIKGNTIGYSPYFAPEPDSSVEGGGLRTLVPARR
jgi:hypothetical protein